MSRLIVVSNRCVQQDDGYIDPFITTLGQIFSKHPGLWFGWNGSVTAGKRSRSCSVTHHAHYATHGWDLSPNEYDNAYQGYVHNVLWPIFHNRPDLAAYKKEYFTTWKSYNTDVARTVGTHTRTIGCGCMTITCWRWASSSGRTGTIAAAVSFCTSRFHPAR